MKMFHVAFAVAVILGTISTARGQAYPSRPISIVVGFSAGGPTDTLARNLAEPMRRSLGQPVVIENVTGAAGSVAITRVGRATPDGYTLILGNWNSHVGAAAIYPIQYDVLKDFDPVSLLPVSRLWMVGKIGLPAKDTAELIAWLKANPNKASVAIVGAGSAGHVCSVYFQTRTGTSFEFVPYRGGAPAYQDLMAGHIDLMCAEASATLPYVRAGKIRAYAVSAKTRWSAAPDTPTLDEVGVPGVYISFWHGLWVPKGTPKDVIAKLNSAVVDALADTTLRQRLAELGQEIPVREQQTPEALAAHHKAEIEKWWPLIKSAGIRAE